MTKKSDNKSKLIRDEIAKIPYEELMRAKPARIIQELEKAGHPDTNSLRSATSKILAEAKLNADASKSPTVRSQSISRPEPDTRREYAMLLIEAFDGDFGLLRAEIDRLERFAKKITSTT